MRVSLGKRRRLWSPLALEPAYYCRDNRLKPGSAIYAGGVYKSAMKGVQCIYPSFATLKSQFRVKTPRRDELYTLVPVSSIEGYAFAFVYSRTK